MARLMSWWESKVVIGYIYNTRSGSACLAISRILQRILGRFKDIVGFKSDENRAKTSAVASSGETVD